MPDKSRARLEVDYIDEQEEILREFLAHAVIELTEAGLDVRQATMDA